MIARTLSRARSCCAGDFAAMIKSSRIMWACGMALKSGYRALFSSPEAGLVPIVR